MARRKKPEAHVNHERWLVSYADFITLLFAFFVVMFAISQVDAKKLGRFAESVQSALGLGTLPEGALLDSHVRAALAGDRVMIPSITPFPELRPTIAPASPRAAHVMEQLAQRLSVPRLGDSVALRFDHRGVTVSLSEAGFFPSGHASVLPEAAAKLREVALALRATGQPIAVEGHTDDVPIATALYPSNWELSTARATSIVRYLVDQMSFDPRTLSATGYAEFRPFGDNASMTGRASNRRVDLVLLTEGASGPAPR